MINRNLSLILSGQLVSQIGDKFHLLAAAYLVLQTTGSPAKMGLVLFCSLFPALVLGPIAGVYLDRCNRKAIIVGADAVRGLVVGGICLLYYFQALSFPALLIGQVLISIGSAFFDPAIPAIIPQIVARDRLTQANSQVQLIRGAAMIIGPALGGLTAAWAGYLTVFAVNAASFLISAGLECFIRLPVRQTNKPDQPEPGQPASPRPGLVADLVAGFKYLTGRPGLMIILAAVAVIHLFVGSIEAVIPVLAAGLPGRGAENLGFIQAFFGLGMIAVSLILSFKGINDREAAGLFGGVFALGLFLIGLGGLACLGVRAPVSYLILMPLVGGAIICAATSFRSILQKEVDPAMTGRVFGLAASVGNVSLPLGLLAVGGLLEYVSPGLILLIGGAVLPPVSAYSFFRYISSVKSSPGD